MLTRTRIVATIGPASEAPATIDALLDAGLDVARVNCAHGTPDTRAALITRLRERAAARSQPLAILADLGGPKLRVRKLAAGVAHLQAGRRCVLTPQPIIGDATRVPISYAGLAGDVTVGDLVYLNDGLIQLTVTAVVGEEVHTEVLVGGQLTNHKGLSVPGSGLALPALTDKDLADLDALAQTPPDFVGLSFVRAAADLALLRDALRTRGIDAAMVAKIEKPQAVAHLDEIIDAADGVMVARGDLGVECPVAEVPILQKRIIAACAAAAVPVITATQMLESMIASPRPTRAEASDVANAVLDGSDAVMLSAETATGQYPVEVVRTMGAIIAAAEQHAAVVERPTAAPVQPAPSIAAAVGRSACLAAESAGAAAIICLTRSGTTARALARWRPRQPLIAATPDPAVWRRLALVWGVEPHLIDGFGDDFDTACERILHAVRSTHRLPSGSTVVITAGLPFTSRGRTNTVRIETV